MSAKNEENIEEESKPFVLILTEPILNFLAAKHGDTQDGPEMKLKYVVPSIFCRSWVVP
jgi:hypothetical protein